VSVYNSSLAFHSVQQQQQSYNGLVR